MQADATVQGMTDDHPLFAFAFRGGRGRASRELEEFDVATSDVDFMWVHLNLRDAAAQAWLRSGVARSHAYAGRHRSAPGLPRSVVENERTLARPGVPIRP